jgi:hypothetical protein
VDCIVGGDAGVKPGIADVAHLVGGLACGVSAWIDTICHPAELGLAVTARRILGVDPKDGVPNSHRPTRR